MRIALHLSLVTVLFICGCQPQDERVAVSEADVPPAPDASEGVVEAARGDIRATLSAQPHAIFSGQSVTLIVENHGRLAVEYGRPVRVERWDGNQWVETAASRDTFWTMDLLLTAPGETGPAQVWPFNDEAPGPGWYRFTKELSASGENENPRVTVRARVLVTDE